MTKVSRLDLLWYSRVLLFLLLDWLQLTMQAVGRNGFWTAQAWFQVVRKCPAVLLVIGPHARPSGCALDCVRYRLYDNGR